MELNILSVRYSVNRNKQFQIKTVIYEAEGTKIVKKEPYTQEATKHIKNMYKNYELLNIGIFKLNEPKIVESSILFPYEEGKSLGEVLLKAVKERDKGNFKSLIFLYKNLLEKNEIVPFYLTKDFIDIFGENELLIGRKSLKVANVDMNFDNIFINNDENEFTIIDYEWVFEFPVPIEFIIFRSVLVFVTKHSAHLKDFVDKEEIFRWLEIDLDLVEAFENLETMFMNYVGTEISDLKSSYLKRTMELTDLMENKPKGNENFIHIFYENFEGNQEMIFNNQLLPLDEDFQVVELSLNFPGEGRIRLEPCYETSLIDIKQIDIYTYNEDKSLVPIKHICSENLYKDLSTGQGVLVSNIQETLKCLSLGSHPIFYIENIPVSGKEILVKIELNIQKNIPNEVVDSVVEKISELKNEKQANREEITKIKKHLELKEKEILVLKNEVLFQENKYYNTAKELNEVFKSKSWKITAPLRNSLNTFRSLKNNSKPKLKAKSVSLGKKLPEPFRGMAKKLYLNKRNNSKEYAPSEIKVVGATSKKVSLIIPVYNNVEYLEDCILSAVNQSYRNLEVIIVDDCSPLEEVQAILDKFKHYDFVELYKNEKNLGISATQNVCMAKSTGDIIAFLDCDDILTLDAIERSLAYWNDETKYSFSNRIHINEESQEIGRFGCDHLPKEDIFEDHLDVKMYASHFKMISRDVFEKVGVFNSDYNGAQDYDMILRVAFHYPRTAFVHVPEFIYKHRLHNKQTSEVVKEKQHEVSLRISNQAKMRRDIREGKFHKFISFIMVSFGKEDQTLMAVKSILNTVKIPFEIILYENGSSSECVQFIKENIEIFEEVKVIYGNTNIGPALGRKEALKHAKKDCYYISLDNDIEVTPGWIEELLVRAEEREDIGSVTCRVTFPNGRLQFTGGYEKITGNRVEFKLYNIEKSVHDLSTLERYITDWNPVGATLFKGWFPIVEGYPNVYEDSAVSYELRKNGKILVNSPNSLLIHHHIMFNEERKEKEKDYLAFRYHPKKMLKSISQFYLDNQLIINDDYIYRINGFDNNKMSDEEIIKEFEKLVI